MRVAIEIDATSVVRGGTVYVRELLKHYESLAPEDEFTAFGWAFRDPDRLRRQIPLPASPRFRYEIRRWPQSLVQRLQWDWGFPLIERSLSRLGAEVYHCFRATGRSRPPAVLTVPDVLPAVRPGWFTGEQRADWHRRVEPGIRAAAAIVTYCEATKRDLVDRLSIPAERVFITPLGVDHSVFRPAERPEAPSGLAGRLPRRFLLMVGPFDVLTGFRAVADALAGWSGERPAIVAVGPVDEYAAGLQRVAAEKGVSDCFTWTGYVPHADVARLYNLSEGLLYPSRLPGVELPPYEAMACGRPVITSLDECVGDAGWVVPAEDPDALRAAMKRLWDDPASAAALIPKALSRARLFTWRGCAEATLAAYRDALRRARQ